MQMGRHASFFWPCSFSPGVRKRRPPEDFDNDVVTVTPKEGSLEVKWTPAKQAASYKVQWRSGDEIFDTGDDRRRIRIAKPRLRDQRYGVIRSRSLKAGTVYAVQVIAVNASGDESRCASDAIASSSGVAITPLPGQVHERDE